VAFPVPRLHGAGLRPGGGEGRRLHRVVGLAKAALCARRSGGAARSCAGQGAHHLGHRSGLVRAQRRRRRRARRGVPRHSPRQARARSTRRTSPKPSASPCAFRACAPTARRGIRRDRRA
jgi:hypothetical protein